MSHALGSATGAPPPAAAAARPRVPRVLRAERGIHHVLLRHRAAHRGGRGAHGGLPRLAAARRGRPGRGGDGRVRSLDGYGPWAVVAGASEGIGAAFARALSAGGLNVVLAARRPEPLAALAATLPTRTRRVTCDLATDEGVER